MPIRDSLSRPIDPTPILRRLSDLLLRRPLSTCAWLGVVLRVWVYLQGRAYWMDEGSLLGNLKGRAPFDFTGPLSSDQLAPPGFLAAERFLIGYLGDSPYVTRLIPLACGIAAPFLFLRLVERLLPKQTALVAMVLFAFSDDLTYYSNELKPYSVDLAIGLAISLLSLMELRDPPDAKRRAGLAALAVASPWLSFPSVFTSAGCGLALLADRFASGRRTEVARLLAVAAAWGASVLLAHRLSRGLLGPATSMYVFWDFAFPPCPPTSRADLAKLTGILLETFVTPLNLVPTMLPYAFALFAAAMAARGMCRIARRNRGGLAIIVLPTALALAAAAMRRYPFHGRLILWLAPACFLLIAEGLSEIFCRRGRAWYAFALAFLLTYPTLDTLYQAVPPHMRDFNPHGDLRRNRFMN